MGVLLPRPALQPMGGRSSGPGGHEISCFFFFFFNSICFYLFGCAGSQLWHVGSSSLTWDGTRAPALRAQSLNLWTARDIPGKIFGTGQSWVCSLAASSPNRVTWGKFLVGKHCWYLQHLHGVVILKMKFDNVSKVPSTQQSKPLPPEPNQWTPCWADCSAPKLTRKPAAHTRHE